MGDGHVETVIATISLGVHLLPVRTSKLQRQSQAKLPPKSKFNVGRDRAGLV